MPASARDGSVSGSASGGPANTMPRTCSIAASSLIEATARAGSPPSSRTTSSNGFSPSGRAVFSLCTPRSAPSNALFPRHESSPDIVATSPMRRELASVGVANGERCGVERDGDGSHAVVAITVRSAAAKSRTIRTRPERDPMY